MKNVATIRLSDIDIYKYLVKIFIGLSRRLQSLPFNFYLLLAFFLLIGCSTTQPPVSVVDSVKSGSSRSTKPIESSTPGNQFYIVQKGDTLYGIALSHGIDSKKLAEWNGISDPKSIRPGQRISLSMLAKDSQPELFALPQQPIATTIDPAIHPSDAKNAIPQESNNIVNAGKVKTSPKALKLPFSEQNVARLQYPVKSPLPTAQSSPALSTTAEKNTKIEGAPQPDPSTLDKASDHSNTEWIWPTTGKLLSSFSKNSKGVKILGQAGQPVLASAAGEVVYSGHGLRGYGNLIIIKHDNTFLSAYAHNSKLLVKEGEVVAKGQKIAEMGNTDTDTIQLHFEIRKHGKPVDPLEYLPHQS
ncbi:peptidoglycan DD-metalloendopeptidase family protein [Nitrosomonas sp.]|uniref:peptidoglycan DD-metalloendopeptidase family protein n=1 Tax=Nitrosomonas sp. TaxID=42353 RepID=UPI00374DA2CC